MAQTKRKTAKRDKRSKRFFVVAAEPRQKTKSFHLSRPVPHDLKKVTGSVKESFEKAKAFGMSEGDKYAVYELVKVAEISPPRIELVPLTPKTKKKK
jgi:hypothetical protein